jgi:hypothetical protein
LSCGYCVCVHLLSSGARMRGRHDVLCADPSSVRQEPAGRAAPVDRARQPTPMLPPGDPELAARRCSSLPPWGRDLVHRLAPGGLPVGVGAAYLPDLCCCSISILFSAGLGSCRRDSREPGQPRQVGLLLQRRRSARGWRARVGLASWCGPRPDVDPAVHVQVQGAGVAIAAGRGEGVLDGPRRLVVGAPAGALDVVGGAAVVERPGTVWPWMIWMTAGGSGCRAASPGWRRPPRGRRRGWSAVGSPPRSRRRRWPGRPAGPATSLVARLMKRACLDPARQPGLPTGGGKAGTLCHVATGR